MKTSNNNESVDVDQLKESIRNYELSLPESYIDEYNKMTQEINARGKVRLKQLEQLKSLLEAELAESKANENSKIS